MVGDGSLVGGGLYWAGVWGNFRGLYVRLGSACVFLLIFAS